MPFKYRGCLKLAGEGGGGGIAVALKSTERQYKTAVCSESTGSPQIQGLPQCGWGWEKIAVALNCTEQQYKTAVCSTGSTQLQGLPQSGGGGGGGGNSCCPEEHHTSVEGCGVLRVDR